METQYTIGMWLYLITRNENSIPGTYSCSRSIISTANNKNVDVIGHYMISRMHYVLSSRLEDVSSM
jgi:hypothetical protein